MGNIPILPYYVRFYLTQPKDRGSLEKTQNYREEPTTQFTPASRKVGDQRHRNGQGGRGTYLGLQTWAEETSTGDRPLL